MDIIHWVYYDVWYIRDCGAVELLSKENKSARLGRPEMDCTHYSELV